MEMIKVRVPMDKPRCPKEGGGGFIDEKPVEVPNTTYYRAKIRHGELEVVKDAKPAPDETAQKETDRKGGKGR